MTEALFYTFAFLTLAFGFLVVANPLSHNPVTSAMFLVLTIVSLAGLFVLLHAYFLAAVQILVYAGAVMVLFLFVIMILDLKSEERRRLKGLTAKILFVLGLGAVSTITIAFFQSVKATGLKTQVERGLDGSTFELGRLLFTHYLLPFEIVSILLLVAMVGVILLSKKDLK
jgi:NADH-quinone oxidoreductase subunit J